MKVTNDTPITSGSKKIAYSVNRPTIWVPDETTSYCVGIFYSVQSSNFTKNNCGTGDGSLMTYNKVYFSAISQDDANSKLIADTNFNREGQNYVNSYGTCTINGKIVNKVYGPNF